MGTPTTARSQAHSAVPLPRGEGGTAKRWVRFTIRTLPHQRGQLLPCIQKAITHKRRDG